MVVSERVTWETCPSCGRPAAVGWVGEQPVEFDCPGRCWVSVKHVLALASDPTGLPQVDETARSGSRTELRPTRVRRE